MQAEGLENPVIIDSVASLISISRWRRINFFLDRLMRVEVPDLGPTESSLAQAAIDKRNAECGCLAGKIGIVAALFGFTAVQLTVGYSQEWIELAISMASSVVVGALAGKTAGLISAQIQLNRSMAKILKNAHPAGGGTGGSP